MKMFLIFFCNRLTLDWLCMMMTQKDWEQVKWKCLFNYIKLSSKCTIWRIYYKYVRYLENFYIINNLKDILVRIFFAISIQRVIKELIAIELWEPYKTLQKEDDI